MDITPPVVTITSPANGSRVTGNVHIIGTAQDNVVLSMLYVDGVLRNLGAGATFNMTWNTNGATRGPHTIFVRATDQAGNVGQSATITVTF